MQRIQSPYILLEYYAPILEKEEISEKLNVFDDIFFYRNKVRIFVILYKNKRFDIKTESYIDTNLKIKRFVPNIIPLKKKEAFERLKEVVESEDVDKQSIFCKGLFIEKYNELFVIVKEKQEYVALEKKNKMMEEEIKRLKETRVQNITNVMIPHIYMNVQMKSLGEEDLSNCTPQSLKKFLKRGMMSSDFFEHTIKMIHYDKEKPENHNIHITEKRDEHVKCIIYHNDRWHLDVYLQSNMHRILEGKRKLISKMIDEHDEEFTDEEYKLLKDYKEELGNFADYSYLRRAVDVIYSSTRIDVPNFRETIKELK